MYIVIIVIVTFHLVSADPTDDSLGIDFFLVLHVDQLCIVYVLWE